MGFVNFDITNCASLHTMASPGVGQAGQLPAGMPQAGGLYIIYNANNNNRYIGKAGNLTERFAGRMAVVNELGLSQNDLQGIHVFWGGVSVYNSPQNVQPFAPHAQLQNGFREARNAHGPAPAMPNQFLGNLAAAPNYAAAYVTTNIDGLLINLEALFIRFLRQMGVGGTITNGQHIGPFENNTQNELIIQAEWGQTGPVPAAHYCITVPAQGAF